jgi:hypothetical protein
LLASRRTSPLVFDRMQNNRALRRLTENPSHHGAGHGFLVSRISMIQVFADGADDGDPFVDGNVLRSHTMGTVG